jgi:hypothetical protein
MHSGSRLHSDEDVKTTSHWLNDSELIGKEIDNNKRKGSNVASLAVEKEYSNSRKNIIQRLSPVSAPSTTLMMAGAVPSAQSLTTIATSVTTFVHLVSVHRNHFLRKQSTQIATVFAFLSKTWNMDKVRSAKAIWNTGGGKKNIAWTLTVMTALALLLLRPLIYSLSKDASSLGPVVL